jgi:esterase/lipase superfamily enzyme
LNQIKSLSLLIRPLPAPAPQQHREEIALAAQQNYAVALVHFATDRQFSGVADPARQFGGGRGELRYGSCEVSIPRDHRLGELEAPSLLRLEFRQNPAKHVVLLDTTLQPAAAFLASLSARVRASPQRNAFIFVHGYKVTFEDAARRTGQMAYDLGFEGAAVFYSWPSQGLLSGYLVDASNIEWSQSHIKAFLLDFLAGSAAENVYLIAHSMGSRALARAVAGIIAERPDLAAKLREIILTAPDIDAAVFRSDIAPALASGGRPVTLYASSDDLALEASEKINGYPRAGDSGDGLVVVKGVETIDATGVDTGFVKHAYFADNRSALSDMYYLIKTGARAAQRFGLVEIDTTAGRHWAFKK